MPQIPAQSVARSAAAQVGVSEDGWHFEISQHWVFRGGCVIFVSVTILNEEQNVCNSPNPPSRVWKCFSYKSWQRQGWTWKRKLPTALEECIRSVVLLIFILISKLSFISWAGRKTLVNSHHPGSPRLPPLSEIPGDCHCWEPLWWLISAKVNKTENRGNTTLKDILQ